MAGLRKAGDSIIQATKVAKKFADLTASKEKCVRCNKVVYATEKEKSSKGTVFHKQCFSCADPSCRLKLNQSNAKTNPNGDDLEIYCQGHVPKIEGTSIGLDAVNMIRLKEYQDMQKKLNTKTALKAGKIDMYAYGIRGDVFSQTLIKDRNDNKLNSEHRFPAVLAAAEKQYKTDLRAKQEELEKVQKEEEDALFKKFEKERKVAMSEADKEAELEWESKLKDITSLLEKKLINEEEFQKRKENALVDLESKKKLRLRNRTFRVMQQQQRETSVLIEKQGDEMLKLIKDQKEQLVKEVQTQIEQAKNTEWEEEPGDETLNIAEIVTEMVGTVEPPPPRAPKTKKSDIMPDEQDDEFNKIFDDHVTKVAENDQTTFTELIHILTGPFLDDLSKARAIYRWITYKDLNQIQFSEVMSDSPMGLLRGIKYGTETYHTLFKRLCSYAGLHCLEVNGKSKSVGYEPGMHFDGQSFRNTWNAVLIDDQWRLVQCNWGARFLVINKDKADVKPVEDEKKNDSIKYQYDEHYFLTDPEEFIQEFFPTKSEWQLLEQPIAIADFENLPLVRSVFFNLGLKFKKSYPAVIDASEAGGTDIRIVVPPHIAQDTAFLYQLRFCDKDKAQDTEFCGAKLDRFVYQSTNENEVVYSVHLPTNGEFYLQIFASKMETPKPGELSSLDGVKLKCICKFKIICNNRTEKMYPLPNCAPGEWGPRKALRQYMMSPVSHTAGVITTDNNLKIKFANEMPLVFLAKLKMNDVDDKFFQDFVDAQYDDERLRLKLGFPAMGQYGVDIYAKPKSAPAEQPLAHVCKYLINVTSVQHPIPFGLAKIDNALEHCMQHWGPQPAMVQYGISQRSHSSWKIRVNSPNVAIRIQVPTEVLVFAHFVKEPDLDYKEHLQIQRENEQTVLFTVHSVKEHGNYVLMIFARLDEEESTVYNNVYNYLIQSTTNQST